MDTRDALLRAILLNPDDDTARLVYADYLEDVNGGNDPKRAEFIRVQCELERLPKKPSIERKRLLNRETVLGPTSKALRDWHRISCPLCKGNGWVAGPPGGRACRLCGDGTTNNGTGYTRFEWRRGFPFAVQRSRFADVLREESKLCPQCVYDKPYTGAKCGKCNSGYVLSWQPTPWAREVAESLPVVAWEIVDREPAGLGTGIAEWYTERDGLPSDNYRIPTLVFNELKGARHTFPSAYAPDRTPVNWCAVYDSPELARDALALAVGCVVRQLCGLSGTGA